MVTGKRQRYITADTPVYSSKVKGIPLEEGMVEMNQSASSFIMYGKDDDDEVMNKRYSLPYFCDDDDGANDKQGCVWILCKSGIS